MAFDMGFDFRGTAGFVTDPAYGVPVINEPYPHTYTNNNGNSINAGWVTGPSDWNDRVNTNDPRIAGYNQSSVSQTFKADLNSGSAPGAGTYTLDLACGDASFGRTADFKVQDNTTVVIDGTNGGSGFSVAAGHFIDATLADVAATTTWTGTTVSKIFSTTTVQFLNNPNGLGSPFSTLAHFRLTLQAAGATAKQLVSSLMLLGVGM